MISSLFTGHYGPDSYEIWTPLCFWTTNWKAQRKILRFSKVISFYESRVFSFYTTYVPTFFRYLKINTGISLEPIFSCFPRCCLFLSHLLSLTWSSALNRVVSPGWFLFSFDNILVLPVLNTHPDTFTVNLDGFSSRSLDGTMIKRLFSTV